MFTYLLSVQCLRTVHCYLLFSLVFAAKLYLLTLPLKQIFMLPYYFSDDHGQSTRSIYQYTFSFILRPFKTLRSYIRTYVSFKTYCILTLGSFYISTSVYKKPLVPISIWIYSQKKNNYIGFMRIGVALCYMRDAVNCKLQSLLIIFSLTELFCFVKSEYISL